MSKNVQLTEQEQKEFDLVLRESDIFCENEFEKLVDDYVDKCGYSLQEARIAASNVLK